jgi:hypothetical protein
MRWGMRPVVLSGLAMLVAGPGLAAENPAEVVKTAERAAKINATSAQGREWKRRNSSTLDKVMMPLLNQCLPQENDDIPTVFSVYVRLSSKGRALEIVTDLDATLGQCMSAGARETAFPVPPHDDYWVQVNMAASL